MRKVKLSQINENIETNLPAVKKNINSEHGLRTNSKKRRTKNKQDLLLEITRATLENAKKQGKYKVIGERKLYYDPT